MISLPSSRRLAWPCLILLLAIMVLRLFVSLKDGEHVTTLYNLQRARYHIDARNIEHSGSLNTNITLEEHFTSHTIKPLRPPNSRALSLLSQCQHTANPYTSHIRLSHIPILNISMVPPLSDDPAYLSNRYFNPAIIPLPSHSTTKPYLLLSRLVTNGMHQESHVCFADICSIHPQRIGVRQCTDDDITLLGSNGGMRCSTKPEKVNIPPTPAKRCSGKWAAFPDIPGFHDPRVFWSGRGEPLIEVNSGSAYGCVGLWIVDLRAVYPALDDVMLKKQEMVVTEKDKRDHELSVRGTEWNFLGVPIAYPYLTELTRNPREGRSEIEKNWVLFYPNGDESWVQYDAMGKAVRRELNPGSSGDRQTFTAATVWDSAPQMVKPADRLAEMSEVGTDGDSVLPDLAPQKRQEDGRTTLAEQETVIPQRNATALLPAGRAAVMLPASDGSILPAEPADAEAQDQPDSTVKGGRTIAQLLSHGFTTPNLTSPAEPACFNVTRRSHNHDANGNEGHWHQGSNSLRLVLCTRDQFRKQLCLHEAALDQMDAAQYEGLLLERGMVVHFSIIHRKFNCGWLPCRYERYSLVWEARKPFRTLAVSRNPILFGEERARPWTREQDFDFDVHDGPARQGDSSGVTERRATMGQREIGQSFTYTPSIAWAWRAKTDDEARHRQRGHEDLGTGYLGDEILVGIGIDDTAQAFVKVQVDEMVRCMRVCPGIDNH